MKKGGLSCLSASPIRTQSLLSVFAGAAVSIWPHPSPPPPQRLRVGVSSRARGSLQAPRQPLPPEAQSGGQPTPPRPLRHLRQRCSQESSHPHRSTHSSQASGACPPSPFQFPPMSPRAVECSRLRSWPSPQSQSRCRGRTSHRTRSSPQGGCPHRTPRIPVTATRGQGARVPSTRPGVLLGRQPELRTLCRTRGPPVSPHRQGPSPTQHQHQKTHTQKCSASRHFVASHLQMPPLGC
mmetsp:Transcript_36272/g.71358  ORF Transcript_36272/g.71358 Transcript_36272/m.71358 type:complete len:238 (+) Transcript_36272:397-1110(+)